MHPGTFKYKERGDIHRLCIEKFVEVAKQRLESRDGQQICRAIPGNIIQRVKVGGDSRDGNADNIHIKA